MDIYDDEGNLIQVEARKQSWWSKLGGGALMIAALLHVILLVIGAFWIFQIIKEPEKKVDFMPPGGGGGERGAENVAVKKMRQITPQTNVKRVFAEGASSNYTLPEQGDNFGEMSSLSSLSGGGGMSGLGGSGSGGGFGKGDGSGSGLGFGGGAGKLFGLIPETMRKRCSKEDRIERLKANGGTIECEEAVSKALKWLKKSQNADGSWGGGEKAAMTGLALLSYFGHCETPISEEFGESSMRGIVYLVNLAALNDGKMATSTGNGWVYEHAIATYALGEAATFCKELKIEVPSLMEMTQKAGQFILDNQNKIGGWAYQYAKDGGHVDVSVTGWQLQALKACSHTGLKFNGMSSAVNKGLDYISKCQADNGGIGYTGKTPAGGRTYFTLTGVGVLGYQMWGKGGRSEVRKGIKYIRSNTKFDYNTQDSDLYVHYYESQVMLQVGGDDWKFYNELFRDQLLKNQDSDGSWKMPGLTRDMGGEQGKIYRTCLATLMLEVYYRFLATGGAGGIRDRPSI